MLSVRTLGGEHERILVMTPELQRHGDIRIRRWRAFPAQASTSIVVTDHLTLLLLNLLASVFIDLLFLLHHVLAWIES